MKTRLRQWLGLILFGLALAIRTVFAINANLFELVYFNGLFPYIRKGQDVLSAILPLPGYYIIIAGLISWIWWRWPRPVRATSKWKLFGRRALNLLGATGSLFLLLWGFNYLDKGLPERMGLHEAADRSELAQAYLDVMDRALHYRAQIPGIGSLENIEEVDAIPKDSAIGTWVETTLLGLGYPQSPDIRIRHIWPKGALRRLSISGIYNPFTGEANVDAALGPLQKTFTIAHELAHAYGITGEADANFAAYLACLKSENPLAQYAAEYVLWRHIASEVRTHYPEDVVLSLAAAIPEVLQKDREAIWRNHYAYKGYFPEVSNAINDTYLKVQGIEAGADDYDRFVNLYFDWAASQQDPSK